MRPAISQPRATDSTAAMASAMNDTKVEAARELRHDLVLDGAHEGRHGLLAARR